MIRFQISGRAVLFIDTDSKVALSIRQDEQKNIDIHMINISERLDSKYYNHGNDFVISKRENKIIYELLDNLYKAYLENIIKNPSRYVIKLDGEELIYYKLFKTVSANKRELLCPSDLEPIYSGSALGLIKYDDDNFILRYHRSLNKSYNTKVILRKNDSRFPELYMLYNNLYEKLMSMNVKVEQTINDRDIDDIVKSMYDIFSNIEKNNDSQRNNKDIKNEVSNLRKLLRELEILIYDKTNNRSNERQR